jgi:outer membrane biogenesis lipoprotein LolB
MSAQTLVKLGRTDAALARLHDGIAAADRTHNSHAAAEMQALLDDLSGLPKSR